MTSDENSVVTSGEPKVKKVKGEDEGEKEQITVQFQTESGDRPYPPLSVPVDVRPDQLLVLVRALLAQDEELDDEEAKERPFKFFLDNEEILESLRAMFDKIFVNKERTVPIIFKPQAIFRVKPVTRCTSSLPGHSQPVVTCLFSPNGHHLASGSGDNTVRFWDLSTETPRFECKAHGQYVLALAWAPDGSKLASGDKNGNIAVWNPETGEQFGRLLTGHKQYITALVWKPLHLTDGAPRKLASSSKDGDVRVWDVTTGRCIFSLTSHTMNVTCLKWGGNGDKEGLIYSASQDRTIKVWRASDGVLCRTLQGHGHWVNVLALNTDYVMRTGAFDPAKAQVVPDYETLEPEEAKRRAKARYDQVLKSTKHEYMVSGSDDFTLFLWNPSEDKKPIARMTGHQQLVNDVKFSPDASFIASASFDKSVRLWDGRTGKFLAVFRGHVQAVYQLAWSADSRLLVSGSADSTLKLWAVYKKGLEIDLPGHGNEIYAVDWSPDGQRVVSAGKDTLLRLWRR